jgi:hypothetical protein
MLKISKKNEQAIEALPWQMRKILQTDINDAIANRVKALKQAVKGNGRGMETPVQAV